MAWPIRTSIIGVAFGACALSILSLGLPGSALADPILMPAGSRVWMKYEAGPCPDADGDDCIGSNLPGAAPPNGIPTTTFTSGAAFATGFAEVLPDRVRVLTRSNSSGFMNVSFYDTYTVGGAAAGPFEITVNFRVTGSRNSIQNGPFQSFSGGVLAEIGTFNPDPNVVLEQFRITPFDPVATVGGTGNTGQGGNVPPFSLPFDFTVSYTRMVSVGDVFDIGYGLAVSAVVGEIEMLNSATIGFDLPDGAFLTSFLGGSFGDITPVPAPSGLLAASTGTLMFVGLPGWCRRRRPKRGA